MKYTDNHLTKGIGRNCSVHNSNLQATIVPYTYLGTPYTNPQGGVHCAWSGEYNCFQGVNIPSPYGVAT